MQNAFYQWAKQFVSIQKNEWIHIDGKSIRSTVSDCGSSFQNFVSLVRLFVSRKEQIFAVSKFEDKKSNESSEVLDLLQLLDLQYVIFTLDALHCQKNAQPNRSERQSLHIESKR